MQVFTDQLNRQITLAAVPERIISLVPSQTELLYALGLEKEVVGITKFCVHPWQWFREKPRVGGTKNIQLFTIHQLSPDLIIANKEENLATDIAELMKTFPVWVSNVQSLQDASHMIAQVGAITGRSKEAATLLSGIQSGFTSLRPLATPDPTAYFIWRDPWMVAGGNTFIHDMLCRCGLYNVFGDLPRYPVITSAQLANSGCKRVLLSSEPYPFQEKHRAELQKLLPDAHIQLVDGEMFSWYGSHLLKAPAYFESILSR